MSGGTAPAVVVTGLSVLGPHGQDPEGVWKRLCDGKSGVSTIEGFDVAALPVTIAGQVKRFDAGQFIAPRDARLMDRFVQLGLVAGLLAVRDAGLEIGRDVAGERTGVVVGSGVGGQSTVQQHAVALHETGMRDINPYYMPMMLINMVAAQLAIRLGITGPSSAISTACATGANAIGDGYRMIQRGETDVVIAGAAEALNPLGIAGFAAARALSRRTHEPERASRPFDRSRDGFVVGEGAAMLVLESRAHARARGARILAELAGYGVATDAYHVTMPEPNGAGAVACMRKALADADLAAADIDHINAHATGTKLGDVSEARAIRAVFGTGIPACSATKSMTGHLLGAAGALEALIAVMSVATDTVPPTINLTDPDPECVLDHVRDAARRTHVRAAISNSFAFGGHNACLVFKKP
ncbi:beta-ketoacyl-ACP synthase II [Micromonospora sp. KC721]|uniref:beta-ketoacyl-ACP synthase II n=1 Tax=Micromonospora sp. KC721 TaxID=2530380 RepID=UPI00104B0770|nr:beta-ketoacyl-ACP synthase II [Micromonospora sp. KC721]TDB81873.1 beta-ketoacyl-[acyl-carrier-protein] synthase II [Micromonospora sp. KC721]